MKPGAAEAEKGPKDKFSNVFIKNFNETKSSIDWEKAKVLNWFTSSSWTSTSTFCNL